MAKKKTLPNAPAIFKAAFDLIETDGADLFDVSVIEAQLNVEEGMLAPLFSDLPSFALAFGRHVDARVRADIGDPDHDDAVRDRLFEALMARFDALQDYRSGIKTLAKSARSNPQLLAALVSRVPQSMENILTAIDAKAAFPRSRLQVAGLTAIWLRCARIWSRDDTDDMAKTMAAVDKALKGADSIARRLF